MNALVPWAPGDLAQRIDRDLDAREVVDVDGSLLCLRIGDRKVWAEADDYDRIPGPDAVAEVDRMLAEQAAAADELAAALDPTCTYLGAGDDVCGADGTVFAVGPGTMVGPDLVSGSHIVHADGATDFACPAHLAAVMVAHDGADDVMVVFPVAEATS